MIRPWGRMIRTRVLAIGATRVYHSSRTHGECWAVHRWDWIVCQCTVLGQMGLRTIHARLPEAPRPRGWFAHTILARHLLLDAGLIIYAITVPFDGANVHVEGIGPEPTAGLQVDVLRLHAGVVRRQQDLLQLACYDTIHGLAYCSSVRSESEGPGGGELDAMRPSVPPCHDLLHQQLGSDE